MAKHGKDEGLDGSGASIIALMERLTRLVRAAEHDAELNPAQWEALRFLARANRFSNSPTALTHYLGATKGTISQTLKALERKGFVEKVKRPQEGRSVVLSLTDKGQDALRNNSWVRLGEEAEALKGKMRRRLEKGLRSLLAGEIARGGHSAFGTCVGCRHFHKPAHCSYFEAEMAGEQTKLCAAFSAPDKNSTKSD